MALIAAGMTLILAHLGGGTFAPLQLLPATLSGVLYALRAHHLENTHARGPALAARRASTAA